MTLEEVKQRGTIALAPFLTVGYPDIESSARIAEVVIESGAHLLELGVPFSDPIAEGRTIQKTTFKALQNGVNVASSLEVVRRLRSNGVEAPLIFMGYYNPFLRFGVESFLKEAAVAGADGVIVADLPTEESEEFSDLCNENGIYLIPLLAPTSTDQRIASACARAHGFIYCVSTTGVTGARVGLSGGLPDLVDRIRRHTDLPVLVGFGISNSEQVKAVSMFADGVVVGSALLDAIGEASEENVLETASTFIKDLIV